jgi:hypothetical protein
MTHATGHRLEQDDACNWGHISGQHASKLTQIRTVYISGQHTYQDSIQTYIHIYTLGQHTHQDHIYQDNIYEDKVHIYTYAGSRQDSRAVQDRSAGA